MKPSTGSSVASPLAVWLEITTSTTARRTWNCWVRCRKDTQPPHIVRSLLVPRLTVMQMDSWQELANPRDLTKIFGTPEYAPWRSLREADDSRYLGLAMPRFLARLPYGAKTKPGR